MLFHYLMIYHVLINNERNLILNLNKIVNLYEHSFKKELSYTQQKKYHVKFIEVI